MPLITRISRLFRADLHAVLDHIEEPETLLRQAIREMEEEFADDERRVKLLNHEHRQLVSRESDMTRSLSEIEGQLDVCFTSDKDDLARALIRRKLEVQRCLKTLCGKREDLENTLTQLTARVDENREQLNSMRQKADLLMEDDPTSSHVDDHWSSPDSSVRDEDVEVAFLREKQKRSGS